METLDRPNEKKNSPRNNFFLQEKIQACKKGRELLPVWEENELVRFKAVCHMTSTFNTYHATHMESLLEEKIASFSQVYIKLSTMDKDHKWTKWRTRGFNSFFG